MAIQAQKPVVILYGITVYQLFPSVLGWKRLSMFPKRGGMSIKAPFILRFSPQWQRSIAVSSIGALLALGHVDSNIQDSFRVNVGLRDPRILVPVLLEQAKQLLGTAIRFTGTATYDYLN